MSKTTKRGGFLGLALVIICAVGGIAASSSMAACQRVFEAGTGTFADSACATPEAGGPFIWVKTIGISLGNGVRCEETTNASEGSYTNSGCTTKGVGNFAKVYEGPYWNVGGSRFESGRLQIKQQLKGSAVLKFSVGIEIECKNSISEGATIEGNGFNQGQGKGRLTYSSCKVLKPEPKEGKECKLVEPITTNPLKAYLANSESIQTHVVEVFEPGQGTVLFTLHFMAPEACLELKEVGVTGTVGGEIRPVGAESQEGLIVFPSPAISLVKHEGVEKKLKLEGAGLGFFFTGAYGTRLATFPEKFGVFE